MILIIYRFWRFTATRMGVLLMLLLLIHFQINGNSIGDPVVPVKIKEKLNQATDTLSPNPHLLRLDNQNAHLLYYGSYHNTDSNHPQFRDIEQCWNRFDPDIAFCEGGMWPLAANRVVAIRRYGEQGLLRFLANRDRIEIRCIEPDQRVIWQSLARRFSAVQIKIYYVLRQVLINREIFKQGTSSSKIEEIIKTIDFPIRLRYAIMSLKAFENAVRRLLPDLKDWRQINSRYFLNILRPGNWLAKIDIEVNKIRDRRMMAKIIREIRRGKRVFALVGLNHVEKQRERLLEQIGRLP